MKQEVEDKTERVEQAERKIKLLEGDLLGRDHEIKSLSHKVAQLEDQLEASEKTAKDAVEKCAASNWARRLADCGSDSE